MTRSTLKRIIRLYESTVGYDPINDGWTAREALDTLREYAAEGWVFGWRAR